MATLTVFESLTLDGYFTSTTNDIGWAHANANDPEWQEFTASNAKGGRGALLFGRRTYEMMAAFWPTPVAKEKMPDVAEGMNRMPKYVASRTLAKSDWSNTTVLRGDLVDEVKKLKADGPDIVVLGSGSVVSQLAQANLVDEYQLVYVPVFLGNGRTLFEGLGSELELKLVSTRVFRNGNIVSTYKS